MSGEAWIGVDLDGTLAVDDGWRGILHIGGPVPAMVERVKRWLAAGLTVKIVTARVGPQRADVQEEIAAIRFEIQEWCRKHFVARIYADYASGLSLAKCGRIHGRDRASIRELFERRGLEVRAPGKMGARLPNGQVAAVVPKTQAELEALIERATGMKVPEELRAEWRHWALERRGDFIARLRARLNPPGQRPGLPFSANVAPFDYGTPAAWEILRRENAGLGSREWKVRICPVSQGVIFRGQLWFWCDKTGYMRGVWRPADGRPSLHHVLWREKTGRALRPDRVVRFSDGNPNNLAPENLAEWTRNELVRESQARTLQRKSRERTEILLARSQNPRKEQHDGHLESILDR